MEDLPVLPPGSKAICIRCEADLESRVGRSVVATLACSVAILALLFPTNLLPLIRIDVFGIHSENRIADGIALLLQNGWFLLAAISAILVIALPFVRFGLLGAVLASLRLGRRPDWLGPAFRWAIVLDPWAMLDVFLLASFVGYYRLAHIPQATVTIEAGGACFIAAALLTMLARATLDRRTVWRAIGEEGALTPGDPALACTVCDLVQPIGHRRCRRCRAPLHARKPASLPRTTALLIAAFALFFPANLYPMDVSSHLGTVENYTIFSGVRQLFESGLWPLGVLIFCTSIAIPAGKILVTGWCVWSTKRRSRRHLMARTQICRIVAELGRWSKTDPFTIVFFVPLMNFRPLVSAAAGWGATAFLMMTLLTMAASGAFDTRLMWDAAAAAGE